MYNAIDLSKYIVSKCVKDGHPVSNLQLQKILYLAPNHEKMGKGVTLNEEEVKTLYKILGKIAEQ